MAERRPTLAAPVRVSLQTLLHRIVFFRPTTAVGQNEPTNDVRVGGSWLEKRP